MTVQSRFRPLPWLLVLAACAPVQEGAGGPAKVQAEPEAPTNRIEIPPLVRSNLGITFATVEARSVAQTLRVPGAFELEPMARHEYRISLPGRVELLVDQFDEVELGQVLYRFRSPTWPELCHEVIQGEQAIETTQAEVAVGQAKLEESRKKLELMVERIEALARADFKRADFELEAAELEASLPRLEAEIRLAETRLTNARRTREHALHRAAAASGLEEEKLKREVEYEGERVPAYTLIDWIEVRAVRAGIVEALEITDGAFVEPPATVLSTVDMSRVRFRANALQGDLPKLVDAVGARIVPPQSPGHDLGESIEAVMTLGLKAHPEERTMTLLATASEPAPWVRPGVSAFLEIQVRSSDGPALAVPRSSIVQDGLNHVLFRRDPKDPNQVLRIPADMGVSDGRWVVLESGVQRGDEVVLEGAYELKLASQAGGSSAGGHLHADGTFHQE